MKFILTLAIALVLCAGVATAGDPLDTNDGPAVMVSKGDPTDTNDSPKFVSVRKGDPIDGNDGPVMATQGDPLDANDGPQYTVVWLPPNTWLVIPW
jgi:hypothetical protein